MLYRLYCIIFACFVLSGRPIYAFTVHRQLGCPSQWTATNLRLRPRPRLEQSSRNIPIDTESYRFGKSNSPAPRIAIHPIVDVVVKSAIERKAKSFTLVNLHNISNIADYMVIVEGSSKPHINALADIVENSMANVLPNYIPRKQYDSIGGWFAIDYGEVIVHIMTRSQIEYYNLESTGKVEDISEILAANGFSNARELEEALNYDQDEGIDPFWKDI